MALRPIVLYPDPVLRVECRPVERFDGELARLVDDMVETMIAAPGVGLAAPQVGVSLRVAVIDLSAGREPGGLYVLVNPTVSALEGQEEDTEGCLSIPEFSEKVERPLRCRVDAFDAAGIPYNFVAEGFLARAVFHELDHLDGVLFVDHLKGLRRERAKRFLRRLVR
jgi:peptide deformylase